MKVLLEAFGGKLSGIMEIPSNMPNIDLLLDLPMPSLKQEEETNNIPNNIKRGRFERTSKSYLLTELGIKEPGFARLYRLVDIY